MEDIITTNPRDAMLIMLNERVGAIETTLYTLTQAITTFSNQTQVLMEGLTSRWFNISIEVEVFKLNSVTNNHIAKIIFDSLSTDFEIQDVYIYRLTPYSQYVSAIAQMNKIYSTKVLDKHLKAVFMDIYEQGIKYINIHHTCEVAIQNLINRDKDAVTHHKF